MRRDLKMPAATLAIFALVLGLAACGGGNDSSSSSTQAEGAGQVQSESSSGSLRPSQEGGGSGKQGRGGRSGSKGKEAAKPVPTQHHDSGGGSARYKSKGGDNSVQEYGREAGSGEFEAAAAALHGFLDARAAENWPVACTYVSKTIVEGLEKLASQAKVKAKGCTAILAKLANPGALASIGAEAKQANARSLRNEGDRGFLIYTGPGGRVFSMPMVNEGGSWKVSSLAGVPLR